MVWKIKKKSKQLKTSYYKCDMYIFSKYLSIQCHVFHLFEQQSNIVNVNTMLV